MAVTTTTHTVAGVGTVKVTADGDITAFQAGGPHGAWSFKDETGKLARVALGTDVAGSVFAPRAKADVDAIVAARNV